jgi:hypothetical protein
MPEFDILDVPKPVAFIDADAASPMDRDLLLRGLQEAAELINRTEWTEEQRSAFNGMREIVFFQGKIDVNGYALERPGCDEKEAIFYWEAVEFLANPDPGVRANTFFHDCWHVVQFKKDGYATPEQRVGREVDAIQHQIEVAKRLNCRPEDIAYLQAFEDSQPKIEARLAEGISEMHHA